MSERPEIYPFSYISIGICNPKPVDS